MNITLTIGDRTFTATHDNLFPAPVYVEMVVLMSRIKDRKKRSDRTYQGRYSEG